MNEQRVPLRQQRDLSQLIQGAVSLYLQNFWPLFGIAAVVIPLGVAGAALQAGVDTTVSAALIVLALTVLQAAVNLLAGAAVIAALGDMDGGRAAEFSRAYDVAFERFWPLLLAALRAFIIVLLLLITIIGIPWAIQRMVRWFFLGQAVILDGTSARAALSYSADAVQGRWWRTLGIAILIGVITGVPSSIVAAFFSLAPVLVSGSVNAVVNALFLPFAITAMTLLYRDLQVRREGDQVV